MSNPGRRNSSRQSSEDHRKEKYVFPPNGLRNSIIIGIIGGIIAFFVPIGISLLNTSQVAFLTAISGVCGVPIVGLLLALFAGAVVGKVAVKRELGIWAGAFVGIGIPLSYISSAFIPSYPGHISSGPIIIFSGAWWGGLGSDIGVILFFAFIGGVMGLLGTRITTHKHPYYYSRRQQ